jgi:hypothetical protein
MALCFSVDPGWLVFAMVTCHYKILVLILLRHLIKMENTEPEPPSGFPITQENS